MSNSIPIPELLAPAGDHECLEAAIANGADAVYFGLRQFNARLRAQNFDAGALSETLSFCRRYNVRAYITLNTLVLPGEEEAAEAVARAAADAGADALIVQDLGLAAHLHRIFPSLPLHASTQMSLADSASIRHVINSAGIRRVILPRELSLDDIARIRASSEVELEMFVHGALCIGWSGQCHASHYLGGRSANRGACAQPCRLEYSLLADGKYLDTPGKRLFSPRDLSGLDSLRERIAAGVACFKIEGRLKPPAYVAAAVSAYRHALDSLREGQSPDLARLQDDLTILFSRGSTPGYLRGPRHADLVNGQMASHQGLQIGEIERIARGEIVVRALRPPSRPLVAGDGFAFGLAGGDERPGARVHAVKIMESGPSGETCWSLRFAREDLDPEGLTTGLGVWKTSDVALEREMRQSYARIVIRHPAPLDVRVEAAPGYPVLMTASDDRGHTAETESETPPEASNDHPLTCALLRDQLGRLGDTPFRLNRLELRSLGAPAERVAVHVPRSRLNEWRRRLVADLVEQRRPKYAETPAVTQTVAYPETAPCLSVLVREAGQGNALLPFAGPRIQIFLDMNNIDDLEQAAAEWRAQGKDFGLCSPRIVMDCQYEIIERQAAMRPDFYLARNWGSLEIMRARHPACRFVGDYSLNLANAQALREARMAGLERVMPALELDSAQNAVLAAQTSPLFLESMAWHHPTLFFTEYCHYARFLGTGQPWPRCGKTCRSHDLEIEDRKGVRYVGRRDLVGRLQWMASHPLDKFDILCRAPSPRPAHLRIELLHETSRDAVDIMERSLM